jgi:hypothetical protein
MVVVPCELLRASQLVLFHVQQEKTQQSNKEKKKKKKTTERVNKRLLGKVSKPKLLANFDAQWAQQDILCTHNDRQVTWN